jgi:hypothetical protein
MQINKVSNFRGNTSKLNFTCIHELCILFIEEFEDIKGVIRICISKKNLQHNNQRKKEQKRANNDLQNILIKTKDRVTLAPLKTGCELRWFRRVGSSCSTSDTQRVNLLTNPVISHEQGKDREVFTTCGFAICSFLQPSPFHNDGDFHRRDVVLPYKVHSQSC